MSRPVTDARPEVWWVFLDVSAFGWIASAASNHGNRLTYRDEVGVHEVTVWRPTAQWARRVMARKVRRSAKWQRDRLLREERSLSYPVD